MATSRYMGSLVVVGALAACGGPTDAAEGGTEDDLRGTPCAGINAKAISADAREFMLHQGMILPLEERHDNGVESTWRAIARVPNEGTCLVVMNVVVTSFGVTNESLEYEVIAAKKNGATVSFLKFE